MWAMFIVLREMFCELKHVWVKIRKCIHLLIDYTIRLLVVCFNCSETVLRMNCILR